MEVIPNSNSEIIHYFEKFKDNENYTLLLEKFDELTKLRVRGLIELKHHQIPEIGPSEELEDFPTLLSDWNKEDIMEVKNIIKLYDTGSIESLEEAIILIEILKRKSSDYPRILDKISRDFEKQDFSNIQDYDQLLNLLQNPQDAIIYSGLWNYLMTLLS